MKISISKSAKAQIKGGGTVFAVLILLVCLISFSRPQGLYTSLKTVDITPTVVIDAGHAALENTIKTPKNHRQANVEIIPKTRLNREFSPFLNCLISRSIINLQIQ